METKGSLLIAVILFLNCIGASILVAGEIESEVRGIWLSRNVISQGESNINDAFERLKHMGFNTVFVNVWFKGKTIYPSQVLENYGVANQLNEYKGWDPLKVAIEIGNKVGINVHAWFEYGLVAGYSYSNDGEPTPIELPAKYPQWFMENREEENYYSGDGYNFQYWIDPASKEGIEFITKIFEECAEKYPDLDGIQTDRFRYPNPQYSFSEVARTKYKEDTEGSDPMNISKYDTEWNQFTEWREEQINNLADTVYKTIKHANSDCIVSAAVVPPYMMQGDDDKMQEWSDWYSQGTVDWLAPMLYGLHNNMDYWINECLNKVPSHKILIPGITLKGLSNAALREVVQVFRKKKCGGGVFWYYGYLDDNNQKIFRDLFDQDIPSTEEKIIIDDSDSYYTKFSQMIKKEGGYNSTYYTGQSKNSWFQWKVPVFNTGNYKISTYIPLDSIDLAKIKYTIGSQSWSYDTTIVFNGGISKEKWTKLGEYRFYYRDSLRIIAQRDENNLIADAIKFEKLMPFKIIDGYAKDENSLILRFDRQLEQKSAENERNYEITPSIQIQNVILDSADNSIVNIECNNFQKNVNYLLKTWNQVDKEGHVSDSVRFVFKYNGQLTEVIDNSDSYFYVQYGDWTEEWHNEGAIGDSYLKITSGNGQGKVYWRYPIPESGYYKVWLYFPDSSKFVNDAQYIIRKEYTTDTLLVDQRKKYSEGYQLESFWVSEGSNLVIILTDKSDCSSNYWIAADAVKIKRVLPSKLQTTDQKNISKEFRLYPNYPNPFNRNTKLRYYLSDKESVNLKIYDLQGRLIKKNQYVHRKAGYNEIEINLDSYSSGLYFYILSISNRMKVGKMTYLK
ncbi:MAG: family 10 glycosylhydrolase [Candidatus Marinimicrobia bacterium]|nr:family 10 glycosylhydrolase [Candidatus Neomarinimicrobiota bacterium]